MIENQLNVLIRNQCLRLVPSYQSSLARTLVQGLDYFLIWYWQLLHRNDSTLKIQ